MEHLNALMLFTAPTANSYKRFAVEPKAAGWSKNAGSAVVQVPHMLKNMKDKCSVVFTAMDPSVNPYLAYAAVMSAGLDGIKNKTDPGDSLEEEADKKSKKARPALSKSLYESIQALESDTKFIKGVMPPDLLGVYLDQKLDEHKASMKALSNWEMEKYFNV